jgi:hypothetical protein
LASAVPEILTVKGPFREIGQVAIMLSCVAHSGIIFTEFCAITWGR